MLFYVAGCLAVALTRYFVAGIRRVVVCAASLRMFVVC